jgi:hypothetical protein
MELVMRTSMKLEKIGIMADFYSYYGDFASRIERLRAVKTAFLGKAL